MSQNYLPKPSLSSSSLTSSVTLSSDLKAAECSEKLGSLLDVIDSVNSQAKLTENQETSIGIGAGAGGGGGSVSNMSESSPYDWIKHFDPTHQQFYYYNYKTGVSQWEQPPDFIEPVIVAPTTTKPEMTTEASKGYSASFNTRTGTFSASGAKTYWETVGRPNDREGRQMAGENPKYFF